MDAIKIIFAICAAIAAFLVLSGKFTVNTESDKFDRAWVAGVLFVFIWMGF